VQIVSDSSRGMLASGAIVLDLSSVPISPREFTIELTARRGLPRPPRVLRIASNVIPIRQGRSVSRELHVATGLPDWHFELDCPGLRFEGGEEPVEIEVSEDVGLSTWKRTRSLAANGPDDRVFELDAKAGRIMFGNGVNGRIPSAVSQVLASYAVCDGASGNLGRNRTWKVAGFAGTFGTNPEPITGGAAESGAIDQRREARRRSRDEHALVSPADIVAAALALPLLEVARSWVATSPANVPRTGEVVLIAMRARPGGEEPERVPETPRWLESIRRRLAPRMPLGSRLVVRAPRYVDIIIRAALDAEPGRDPAALESDVRQALRRRFAPVALSDGTDPRDPGDPVTRRDVAAWIRSVGGVRRITSLELRRADGRPTDRINVAADGLPRWRPEASRITVSRPTAGAAR
jgi:predicted phage baseplate assembly protein